MAALNKTLLIGNLTRNPEGRKLPSGKQVTDLTLAINRRYKNEAGELVEECDFIDVVFWGKAGEILCQYCHKGDPLYIEGSIRLEKWEDKNTGKMKTRLRVIGEQFEFLKSKSPA